MDHLENEQDNTVESAITEVHAPPKKQGFLKVIVIVLIVIFVLSAAAIAGMFYLRSSPQIRHISRDALTVARVDLPRLLAKADMKETKKDSLDDNLREALEELNMEALLTDPKSTGLVTVKPCYYFLEYNAKQESVVNYFVIPISDGKKLAKFIKGITPLDGSDIEVKHAGDKYVLENDNVACAWNASSLILGVSDKTPTDMLLKSVQQYLDQPKAKSLATNRQFKKAFAKGNDLVVWVNTDAIATIAEKGFKKAKPRVSELLVQRVEYDAKLKVYDDARLAYDKAMEDYYSTDSFDFFTNFLSPEFSMEAPEQDFDEPANVFEQLLFYSTYSSGAMDAKAIDSFIKSISELRGTSISAYANFTKGRIISGIKTNLSPALITKYKAVYKDLANIRHLAKFLPQDRLISTMTYQVNWNELWKVSAKQFTDVMNKRGQAESQKYFKHFKDLCDGSAFASMNLSSGKDKEPFFTVVAAAKKNTGILGLLKELDKEDMYLKSGKIYKNSDANAKDAFILDKDVVIWTSNYSQYKKCDYGLSAKDINKSKSAPMGLFFDIAQLAELAGDDLGSDAEGIFSELLSLSITSKSHRNIPDDFLVELILKDKSKNSLSVFWETLTDNVEVFENLKSVIKSRKDYHKTMKNNGMGAPTDSTLVMDTLAVVPSAGEYDYTGY